MSEQRWTFLSNHSHVLICIVSNPEITLRELSDRVGITERAVHKIIGDLVQAGYLEKLREGRKNRYRVNPTLPLRHPVEAHCPVGDLLAMVGLRDLDR